MEAIFTLVVLFPGVNRHVILKGTLPQKSMWALNVDFSMKVTMVPFI